MRGALEAVQGALVNLPAEIAERGNVRGAKQLWTPRDENDKVAPLDQRTAPPSREETDDGGTPGQLEELIEIAPPSEADVVAGLGGQESVDEILRSRLVKGIDGLGWYVSFHQIGAQWGIYLPVSGVVILASGALRDLPCDFATKIRLALRLIYQHELFHFAVDYGVAQIELMSNHAIWTHVKAYMRSLPPGYSVREEQLANAWMLRSLRRSSRMLKVRGSSARLRQFVRRQPEGYRDAEHILAAEPFALAVEDLVFDYAEISGALGSEECEGLDCSALLPIHPDIDWRQCPVHVIHDEEEHGLPRVAIDLLRVATEIIETDAFRKDLLKLGSRIERAWPKTKEKILFDATIPGLDFKHFEDRRERVYSVRVDRAIRAHLRPLPSRQGVLEAFRIGGHRAMGHG